MKHTNCAVVAARNDWHDVKHLRQFLGGNKRMLVKSWHCERSRRRSETAPCLNIRLSL